MIAHNWNLYASWLARRQLKKLNAAEDVTRPGGVDAPAGGTSKDTEGIPESVVRCRGQRE
jgi:hypothetical protein